MSRTIDVIQHHMAPQKPTAAVSHKRPAIRSGTFSSAAIFPFTGWASARLQLSGPGVWGQPADRAQAIAVLRRAIELGINLLIRRIPMDRM